MKKLTAQAVKQVILNFLHQNQGDHIYFWINEKQSKYYGGMEHILKISDTGGKSAYLDCIHDNKPKIIEGK